MNKEEDVGASYSEPNYPKENSFATRDLLLSFLEDDLETGLFKNIANDGKLIAEEKSFIDSLGYSQFNPQKRKLDSYPVDDTLPIYNEDGTELSVISKTFRCGFLVNIATDRSLKISLHWIRLEPNTPSSSSSPLSTISSLGSPTNVLQNDFGNIRSPSPGKDTNVEEKVQEKAERQRQASKRYRDKKKVLTDQLQKDLAALEHEKKRIEQERAEALDMVKRLQIENEALRTENLKTSGRFKSGRMLLLEQLEKLMANNAPEQEIAPVVHKLNNICRKISDLSDCHFNLMMRPSIIHQLTKSGFFRPDEAAGIQTQSETYIQNFVRKLLNTIHNITPEQHAIIQADVKVFVEKIEVIRSEREQLHQDLITQFEGKHSFEKMKKEQDMAKFLQMMATIEYLRKSVNEEINLSTEIYDHIMTALTVKQQAQFYLDLEFQHNSLIQLRTMWDSLSKSIQL